MESGQAGESFRYVRRVDFSAFRPNEFHSQFIADKSTGITSCILLCTRVPPGKGTSSGLHVHVADQFYYILSGTMTAQIGSAQLTAPANSLVFIPAGAPHWNWNDGDVDEVHAEIIVPAPPEGQPIVYRTSVPGLSTTPVQDPFFVRALDESRFDKSEFSVVTLAQGSSGSRSCRINVVQVPPGKGSPPLHIHSFDQFYFVVEGEMQLQIGRETYTAGPNTYVLLPAGVPHANWNEGPRMERHIAVLVPEALPAPPADIPVLLP